MSLTCPNCGIKLGLELHDLGVESSAVSLTTGAVAQSNGAVTQGTNASVQEILGSSSKPLKSSTRKSKYEYNDPGFKLFYEVYPLKRGKQKAYHKYQQVVSQGIDSQMLVSAAIAYRDDPRRDPNFTKWPATWLNEGCWDDVLTVEPPPRTLAAVDEDFDFGAQQAARMAEEDAALAKLMAEEA